MIIQFRQGIISAQTDNAFLELVSGKVNINVDIERLDVAFAYTTHDYLFTEAEQVIGAWGPFPSNQTAYLYWDIDLVTGVRTFGTTNVAPSFGTTLPSNPLVNQHYFDYNDKKMKVWTGVQWAEKLRVFAGSVQNNSILTPNSLGTQVGLNGQVAIGYILFDSNNQPLRVTDRSGRYYFLTTEDQVHTQQDIHNAYKIDSLLMDGKAIEPIPTYHCVTWKGPKQLGVASYVDYARPCVGISVEPFGINEIKKFVTKGFLTNYNFWNWTQPPNTPLWVGDTGQLTTEVPQKWSIQKVGHIVSPDTVFIDIEEQILIETNVSIPSPTPSITPTGTPVSSLTRTPTPTPSASRTATPSPTPTISASPLVSPTPTHSVSPTPSVTPTMTAGASVDTDYISLYYRDSMTTQPASITISKFNGITRDDFGSADLDFGQGSTTGDNFTRKLNVITSTQGSGIAVNNIDHNLNIGDTAYGSGQMTYSGNNDAGWIGNQVDTQNIMAGVLSYTMGGEGPNYYMSSLTVSQRNNNYALATTRYSTSQQADGLLFFVSGQQYQPSFSFPSMSYLGFSGISMIPTFEKPFMIGFDTGTVTNLHMVFIEPTNIDSGNFTADLDMSTILTINNPPNAFFPDTSNPASIAPEIYEVKYSQTNDVYYISMVNIVQKNRQSIQFTTDTVTTRQPYLLVYSNTNNTLNFVPYNSYDYSYITTSDNYGFTITPDFTNTPYGAILNVFSIGSDTTRTSITSMTLTDPDGFPMPPLDARIRSVETQDDLITIYTFGYGIYQFVPSTQTLSATNISDVWQDMKLLNDSGENLINNVIDTWAGKLFKVTPV